MWKALSGVLATREALFSRKCAADLLCPFCKSRSESIEHMLLLCDWSRKIWYGSPLTLIINPMHISSFANWYDLFVADDSPITDYDKSYIACLCWNIWKTRSVSVFNAAAPNPSQVLISTAAAVNEFWKINHSLPNITRSSEIFNSVWKPPDSGIVKINCDGAFSEAKKMAAIGIIACDSSGSFLKGWRKVVDADSGFLSELLACKKEVQLASEFNEARLL
ncbi:uncharacterized protein LOC129313485 isoform X2 [Prosopis cineraria]|uniref:uncharacterized protein LOC129313485 isoform X2 n=1 Tax=Prosopis cineraria TaxID=364024 RepID=UPI002410B19F|nr:uncharacterized protein LOC129313485 isoform X2 [Prosopis cineraria]